MCDYSEAELAALEAVFPVVTVYLCDFHWEQAWERWTNERKHGLTDKGRDQLLYLLRECANAPSPPVDAPGAPLVHTLAVILNIFLKKEKFE